MKILFAAPEQAWGGFLGLIRKALPNHTFDATGRFGIDTLKGYDILIPTMCKVTAEILEQSDRLRLIQQCGAGLEGIDIEAAKKRGIRVANVPTDISGNADSVAELGIYMMIGLCRNFKGMAQSLLERKMGQPQGKVLMGRIIGLVGLGGIAKALIQRLKPFQVKIIGIKRNAPEKAKVELGLDWVGSTDDLPILLNRSDFVVLCLPMTSQNQHIINSQTIAYMKPDAYLINLSRGGLIDRDALEVALSTNRIAGAGLDVFWEEPPDPTDPIFQYNVLATPHIGGSTDISMNGIAKVVAENITRIEKNEMPLYCA